MAIGYVEEVDFTAWLAARGYSVTGTASQLLTRSLDWVEQQSYKGSRTDSTQVLSWPRQGVCVDGALLASDSVPDIVKELQMRAAYDIDAGSDPLAVADQAVQAESVAGAVSVTYASGSAQSRISSQTSLILGKISNNSGMTFTVSRG